MHSACMHAHRLQSTTGPRAHVVHAQAVHGNPSPIIQPLSYCGMCCAKLVACTSTHGMLHRSTPPHEGPNIAAQVPSNRNKKHRIHPAPHHA